MLRLHRLKVATLVATFFCAFAYSDVETLLIQIGKDQAILDTVTIQIEYGKLPEIDNPDGHEWADQEKDSAWIDSGDGTWATAPSAPTRKEALSTRRAALVATRAPIAFPIPEGVTCARARASNALERAAYRAARLPASANTSCASGRRLASRKTAIASSVATRPSFFTAS